MAKMETNYNSQETIYFGLYTKNFQMKKEKKREDTQNILNYIRINGHMTQHTYKYQDLDEEQRREEKRKE